MPKKYIYVRKTQWFEGKKYEATGKTEKEALRKLAEKLAAAKRGEGAAGGNMTVDAYFKLWLETYKRPKEITPKSLAMYGEKYRNYISPEIGACRLKDVRDIQLQAILNREAGKSASHVKKLRMVMKEMFKRARQSRLILYDPAELLELPSVTEGRKRALTPDERAAIVATARTHPKGLWITALLQTGMRPGESAALRWEDIDFEKNEIHIRRARESGSGTIKAPKTESGFRDIPLRRELRELLEAARDAALLERGAAHLGDYVFPGPGGKAADDNAIRRWWKSFLRAADIANGATVYRNKIIKSTFGADLTLYCLRHTFATDLQRAGVPLNVAKELMGHSDIAVTANVYTHRDTIVLHAGIAALDALEDSGEKG